MQLHDLKPAAGSRHKTQRIGRGTGSGRGKTSGRGQKGQLARSEGFRLGFEGGQMPLAQRLPKLGGFKNRFKRRFAVINLTKLNHFSDGTEVTEELLWESGLARQGEDVKILGTGKLGRKLTVQAHAFSETARAAIEAKGGTVVLLEPVEAAKAPAPVASAEEPAPAAEPEAEETETPEE